MKNKNTFYARIVLGCAGGLLAFPAYAQKQPNVVYVFPDQFRNQALEFWNETGFKEKVNFTPDPVHTPHLNRFAKESFVLTSAVSNCPLSSPHRGMLLTGMYPDGSGVPLNCNNNRPISSLNIGAVTISDVFSKSGYDCAYIGKYHVDFPTPNDPQNQGHYVEDANPVWDAYTPPEHRHGFNYWYSYGTFDVHKHPHYWDTEGNRQDIEVWSPTHEADKAIAYLKNEWNERDGEKPFFLMVSMNPPHSPYHSLEDCMEEDYNLYKDVPIRELLIRPNANLEMEKAADSRFYFSSITGIDREFGRIMAALKELGLDENTIVIFTSDHGETMCSQGVDDPKNTPYTESLNVPFMVRYPDKIKPYTTPLLLSTPDIMPTVLGLCGLHKDIPQSVQGRDLSPVFYRKTNKYPKAALYIQNMDGEKSPEGIVLSYFPSSRGIKTDRYTLAIYIDKEKNMKKTLWFDDVADPYQMNNLDINPHSGAFKQLCKQLAALLKETNDPWYRERILPEMVPYK